MLNNRLVLAFGLTLLVLGGCSSGKRQYSDLPAKVPEYTENEYRIGVGDQINILVWRNPELTINGINVRPDGKVSAPLVGDVFVSGKTTEQLATELEKTMANYVRSPQVTVVVTGMGSAEYSNRVRVTGAVVAPSSVPYRKDMTVLDLVLLAGGVTEFANANGAKLYRKTKTGVEVHKVYLKDILNKGDVRSNYTLMPSDMLTVPEGVL